MQGDSFQDSDRDAAMSLILARQEDSHVTSTDVTSTDVEKHGCCPICYENLSQHQSVLRLVCSHVFHEDCLLPWLGMWNAIRGKRLGLNVKPKP